MAIYGNFVWWQGVVEDRMDPLYLGRCRVRILGYHTDDKIEIPTNCLPWATIMQPTTSAAISGIGTTPTGPVEGTWVIGFFRDGEDAQEPVIMGTIGGIPEERGNPKLGFNDPGDEDGQQTYPKDTYLPDPYATPEPKPAEPDTNRLARGNMVIPTEDPSCLVDLLVPESNGEQAISLKWKRATRQEAVPKALAGNLSSSIENTNEKIYASNTGGTTTNLEENLDTMSVSGFDIISGGSGYTTEPIVTFSGNDSGANFVTASATAIIESGVVTGFKDLVGGTNYTGAPIVTISPPPEGGTPATATANVHGVDVSGISKFDEEEDYPKELDDLNYYWNEPLPRYGGVKKSKTEFRDKVSSTYPKNHVRESECGHVEEWDDTPGSERLHRYHTTGTFEEIQSDGTRVVKIVGDDYEIVAGDKNVLIDGACSVTVKQDCRLLVEGSLVQEVRGNYHLNVREDMRVKVGGNMVQEIMSARKIKVEKDDDLKVGKDQIINIGKNAKKQIGKSYTVGAGGAIDMSAGANILIEADISACIDAGVNVDIIAKKIGMSGVIIGIAADTILNVSALTELHEVGLYNCAAVTTHSVEAGGAFALVAGAEGVIGAAMQLGIAAGTNIGMLGVTGVNVVSPLEITLN